MEQELIQAFKGKNILVTGHTGFKGSWLSFLLSLWGAHVSGISLPPPTSPSHFDLIGLKNLLKSHNILDIRDAKALSALMQDLNPSFIFHLAAQPLVLRSYEDPLETFDVNVLGTAHVLEAARRVPSVQGVLVITTDKVYENDEEGTPFKESDPLGASDPYSTSKAMAELLARSYYTSFFKDRNIALATARAGNVIGGGDFAANRLIPDIIRSLIARKPVPLRNPSMRRPWMHVLDPVFGYVKLASKMLEEPKEYSTAFNFGPNEKTALTCREIVDRMIALHGEGNIKLLDSPSAPKEKCTLQLNSDKSKALLDFHPAHSIDSALKDTLAWYTSLKSTHEAGSMRKASLRSLETYLSLDSKRSLIEAAIP